jgi:alpha-L-arabinofuranosidase
MAKRNHPLKGILKVSQFILLMSMAVPVVARAQMTIYSNALVNGWENSSYNATLNFANSSPVYVGSENSISVTVTSAYGGIQLSHATMTNTAYTSISFVLNGGASGGQSLQMYGNLTTGAQSARYYLGTPLANTWQQYWVPLSALGVANVSNFTGFAIQDSAGTSEPTFYLDDIQLSSYAAPPLTPLTVNASQPIRTADARWFGLNATIWDNDFDTPQTIALLTNMGIRALRFPGGSTSDDYHWLYNRQDEDDWSWETSLASYIQVITNIGGETMITLNYGTGTSNEAAAWVAYVNASTTNTLSLGVDANGFNWGTAGSWAALRAAAPLPTDDGSNFLRISRTAPLGFKYWEIGNEEYGSWETDSNNVPHDPYTYAERASGYIALIKAVDPEVKIGVVAVPGTNSFINNENHPATDPVTGQVNYGWTPVLLATLKGLGVTPDFAIYHNYPYNPGGESDAGLLGCSGPPSGWASAASSLRQMITDYMGPNGTNTELVCTENNSVSSSPGKQSVSLVNGLYKMDSVAQLMQTEFNGLFWWALRNGQETDGNMSTNLYGWRLYGDYGVVNIADYTDPNLYPTYYTTELIRDFVQTGDTVMTAASPYSLLSTYAVLRQNGSLTVLTINKDPVNTLTGDVSVTGFNPASNGVVYSYGIPQDGAVENGSGSTGVSQTNISVTGTNITYAFQPYSATVLVLPAASSSQLTASAGGPETICAGASTPIGGSPTATGGAGGYTYSWSPATGLSSTTAANPMASPANTTIYTVTVTDSSKATAKSSVTVTVHALPTVSVNSPAMCAGGSATLTATTSASSPGYLWSPGGATTASVMVSPSSTTAYSVTVTDGTTGCANSGSGIVTINPLATANAGGNQKICAGSSTAPLGGSIGGGATGGTWTTSGSGTIVPNATTLNATYDPSVADITAGTVTLTLTSTGQLSPCGAATAEVVITLNPLPTITLGNGSISAPYGSTNANLSYTATPGGPDGYNITYSSTAQAAGFTNVALTPLPASPIKIAVPSAAGTNTYNGTLTLNNSSTGCSSTNYAFAVVVVPLAVTLTGTRPYDGTAIANSSILTIVTNYDSTNLTLSGSATLARTAAGLQSISNFSGLSLGGNAATNYTLTGASGFVMITALPLILTGTRAYDGTATAAAGILSVVNAVGSDDVSLATGSAVLASASVGPEVITSPGSLTLGGLAAGNYTLTGVSGIVTITNPFIPFSISSSSLDIAGTNFVVCWHSVPGAVYNVLTNTSLGPPQSWAVAGGPITATNTTTCFTMPGRIVGNTSVYVVIQQ